MKIVAFIAVLILLMATEILRVYFIMPFPGSQQSNTISIAYFIHQYIWIFRLVGWLAAGYWFVLIIRSAGQYLKVTFWVLLSIYGIIFYTFNFRFLADKMFLQPTTIAFTGPLGNKVPAEQLILGVSIGNQSRAYPIEVIGYHHQVRDTLNGQPIMVTYCTVCRTGRVYSPEVDGNPEEFRLVGMDHYNAMFEDKTTGSWWRQVTGEAIAGSKKGSRLNEIASEQMSLAAWIRLHPKTTILQPDTTFQDAYAALKDYDEGKMKGRLESKDSLSWKEKSWVVGVIVNGKPKAYDWNDLTRLRLIQDGIDNETLMVVMENDSATFHVLSRTVDGEPHYFALSDDGTTMTDEFTRSIWSLDGQCTDGQYAGKKLDVIQSYQEYWHSWKLFRGQDAYHPKK